MCGSFNIIVRDKSKCTFLLLFHLLFPWKYVFTFNISWIQWGIYSFVRCSEKSNFKVSTKNIQQKIKVSLLQGCFWSFDQWKTFSRNYKPVGVFIYKTAKNISCSQHFELSYSLLKISILTEKLLVRWIQIFSCELNSSRTYFLQCVLYMCCCEFKIVNKILIGWERVMRKQNILLLD